MNATTITDPGTFRQAFGNTELSSRYELIEEAGRGGMGVVYKARHRLLGQLVAIKVHALQDGADRFQREAKLLASIRSPHVVGVQDLEVLPTGQTMMAMTWIAGTDLEKLSRQAAEPLPESRVLAWMIQVCDGMRAAAEQGIVHRDLKPSNILIDEADGAYVADFGLARNQHDGGFTMTGGVMGTPLYMAPEQAEDPRKVDTRADIYSYGATFYHVLTGTTPFSGESWFSILFSHKTEPLVSPKSRNPTLSPQVNDVLERCLAKSPQDRFQSFAELARSLRAAASADSAWANSDDPEVARQLAKYRSRRHVYLDLQMAQAAEPDVYQFPNGRACAILFGNIVEQRVDALVKSDNATLTLGAGDELDLASQVYRSAGPEYADTLRRFAPVRPGRAIVTSAGRLPFRFVLHAVAMGKWGTEVVNPSRDLVNEIMDSCFYHADTLGLESLAFPLLATRAGLLPKDVCLDAMFRFLARKLSHGITTVKDVRIVLFSRRFLQPTPVNGSE